MSSGDYLLMKQSNPELAAKLTKAIGITTGIILQEAKPGLPCKPYRVRIYDKHTRKYASETFQHTDQLVAYAKDKWAGFEKQTDAAGRVTLDAMLPGWLESLRAKGNQPRSIREIKRIMDAAREFGINDLKADGVAREATRFLETYRPPVGFGIRRMEHSVSTRLRYITHFRALGNYCCKPSLSRPRPPLSFNPFAALVRPKTPQVMMNVLTVSQARSLVSDFAITHFKGEDPRHRLDGMYFALRLYTGMRQKEASWLRWEHILWEAKLIRVTLPDATDWAEAVRLGLVSEGENPDGSNAEDGKQVKGRKERFAILADELAEILMKLRPDHGRGYLFRDAIRSRDSANDGSSFQTQLKHCGIDRPELTPHDLRSSNACLWLAAGLDVSRLVNHLGHTTVKMTNHYAQRANEYRVQCKDWAGEIRLRTGCNTGSTNATAIGHDQPSEPSPEDEIDDCVVVILPEKSPIFGVCG